MMKPLQGNVSTFGEQSLIDGDLQHAIRSSTPEADLEQAKALAKASQEAPRDFEGLPGSQEVFRGSQEFPGGSHDSQESL